MRISTKLRIGYIFSALIVIFAGAIIYLAIHQMDITGRHLKYANTITQSVFELNIFGNEFLLYREQRPKTQWHIKHKTLSRLLGEENFNNPNNQSLVIRMREDLEHIRALFLDLSRHSTTSDILENEIPRKMQNRLQSQLLLELQKMLSYSTQLKNQIADELFSIQQYTIWLSITVIMATAFFSVIIGFLTGRSITLPLKTLMRGTETVASGNLDFRLETDRKDEIGQLSHSFDQMVTNLKTVMVSRDELGRMVEERTAELAASNRQLTSEIEERKHAQGKLRAAELKYRTVADYTYDWEYWENPDGTLQYVSPSCERISGYTAQDFLDNPLLLSDIIVPEDKETWNSHRCIAHNELKSQEMQFRIQRRDGEIRWIEHACQTIPASHGTNRGLRASNRDITLRKQAELEAQKHREELTYVTRVVTLGELSASLAHELNQPLTAILSNAQAALRFLSKDSPDLDEVREILEDIVDDDQRASDIIRKLRALMRRGELELKSLDLNEVIREVVALVGRDRLVRDIPIVTALVDDLPPVRADFIHLEQLVLNLILNSADAMAALDHQSCEIRILPAKIDEHFVTVSIRDTGIGIDEESIESIFDTFYTTKPGGMGMGLSICRSIIEAHGGKLWAENNPDRGAAFHFTVPVYDESG
jgi:PAS domain S-box-containing protein